VKKAKNFLALMLATILVTGCGTVGRGLDPYYQDFSCPKGEGFSCMSVEDAYELTERGQFSNHYQQMQTPGFSEPANSGVSWKGVALGTLGGAAVGAGIGALMGDSDKEKMVKHTLPGGGSWYEIVKKDGNKVTTALIGAAVGGGTGAVLSYLVSKMITAKRTVSQDEYARLQRLADKYHKCIGDAARLEKKKGSRTAAMAAEKCSALLASVPGINLFKSEQISTAFKLKMDRENEVKKELARLSGSKNVIPLRTPPKVASVLITPWVDEKDVLHQGEKIFVVLDSGRWIMPQRREESGAARIVDPLRGGR